MLFLQAEVSTMTEQRDRAHKGLEESRRKYEEVTETIAEYTNDSGELEQEINSLRIMLREAREQKERAISARTTSDRERDEYVSKYEEKCREMERMQETTSTYHSHSAGGGGSRVTSTRIYSRGGEGSSHQKFDGADGTGDY